MIPDDGGHVSEFLPNEFLPKLYKVRDFNTR